MCSAWFRLLLELTTVPSRLARWVSCRLRRRREWEVLVCAGVQADYRPRLAVLRETWPDRSAAATRAEELWTRLAGDGTPPA